MRLRREILLTGTVEGVGMRPALFRYAVARRLDGFVENCSGCVRLVLQGELAALDEAMRSLPDIFPSGSRVDWPPSWRDGEPENDFDGFSIRYETAGDGNILNRLTPPDHAPCPDCLAELNDPSDRRFGYAFNACAVCGPRETVVEALPYDREQTSWSDFPLCPACRAEYDDPGNRRFRIEGISCPVCGPRLEYWNGKGELQCVPDALAEAVECLKNGGILALKGVGGFQLLADPRNAAATGRLRLLKHRPDKPLALMAESLAVVRNVCLTVPEEETVLSSAAAPIVLLRWRAEAAVRFHADLLAPDGADEVGIMLPSSPLHGLLLHAFGGGLLIASSGNLGGEPPALSNSGARAVLRDRVDGFLVHNREIRHRNDDSLGVVCSGRLRLWRRGRGYDRAMPWRLPRRILAVGALWKNTFALAAPDCFLLSTHHGGLENADVADAWEADVRRTLDLFGAPPEAAAVDLHGDYASTRVGRRLAAEFGVPVCPTPHHYAHAFAGLLESGLPRALALVFDGTGLGPDGTLWGAELLAVGMDATARRLASWLPAKLPGGDLAVIEPWRQFLARKLDAGSSVLSLKQMFPGRAPAVDVVAGQCRENWNAPATSSAGRLFDAAAVLFGVSPERISYEGQAAVRLESLARRQKPSGTAFRAWRLETDETGLPRVSWKNLFAGALPETFNALDFHIAVADAAAAMVCAAAPEDAPDTVILTGGVFQNRLLADLVVQKLTAAHFQVFVPELIPPNDAGIAVGQCVWGGLAESSAHWEN